MNEHVTKKLIMAAIISVALSSQTLYAKPQQMTPNVGSGSGSTQTVSTGINAGHAQMAGRAAIMVGHGALKTSVSVATRVLGGVGLLLTPTMIGQDKKMESRDP